MSTTGRRMSCWTRDPFAMRHRGSNGCRLVPGASTRSRVWDGPWTGATLIGLLLVLRARNGRYLTARWPVGVGCQVPGRSAAQRRGYTYPCRADDRGAARPFAPPTTASAQTHRGGGSDCGEAQARQIRRDCPECDCCVNTRPSAISTSENARVGCPTLK